MIVPIVSTMALQRMSPIRKNGTFSLARGDLNSGHSKGVRVRNASGISQGNLPEQAMLATVKLRGRRR